MNTIEVGVNDGIHCQCRGIRNTAAGENMAVKVGGGSNRYSVKLEEKREGNERKVRRVWGLKR